MWHPRKLWGSFHLPEKKPLKRYCSFVKIISVNKHQILVMINSILDWLALCLRLRLLTMMGFSLVLGWRKEKQWCVFCCHYTASLISMEVPPSNDCHFYSFSICLKRFQDAKYPDWTWEELWELHRKKYLFVLVQWFEDSLRRANRSLHLKPTSLRASLPCRNQLLLI